MVLLDWRHFVCVIFFSLTLGFFFGYRARKWIEKNFNKADVEVQGPVTYTRKNAQPRFIPLREDTWGVRRLNALPCVSATDFPIGVAVFVVVLASLVLGARAEDTPPTTSWSPIVVACCFGAIVGFIVGQYSERWYVRWRLLNNYTYGRPLNREQHEQLHVELGFHGPWQTAWDQANQGQGYIDDAHSSWYQDDMPF